MSYNGTTVKELKTLWEGCQHNFIYDDQYVMRVIEFGVNEGHLLIELEDDSRRRVNPHMIIIETTEETKRKELNEKIASGEIIVIYKRCPGPCGGREFRFELSADKVRRWRKDGEAIQNVFPDMTPDDRETLISGICKKCFEVLFPDV